MVYYGSWVSKGDSWRDNLEQIRHTALQLQRVVHTGFERVTVWRKAEKYKVHLSG